MTDVTTKHPDYLKNVDLWSKVEDVCEGQHKVKAAKEKYLPRHNKQDNTPEAMAAYDSYLEHAVFYGVTGKTLGSLIGGAFSRLPNFQRPDDLEYLERNANGQGVGIYQIAQASLRHVLKTYRCALYVDYPNVTPSKVRAEDYSKQAFPMIHVLPAKSVINWDTIIIGNQQKLSLVVIHEEVSSRAQGGFNFEKKDQFRVLRLEEIEGSYVFTIQVYKKNTDGVLTEEPKTIPTDYNGKRWDYIPFTFVGAIDNTPAIESAPLLELADLNLAHYIDSADFQESVYFVGQPQFFMENVDTTMYEIIKKDGLYIGCKNAFPVKLGFAQANPNTLSQTAMEKKWEQMKELGARLVQAGSANKTATEANNDDAVQHSVLSLCTVNISAAITQALRWCAKFAMPNVDSILPEELVFEISKEFSKPQFDNERSKQLYDACVAGKYPFKVWHEYQQTGEFPDYSYEEIQEMLEEEQINSPMPAYNMNGVNNGPNNPTGSV
ncbi:DUF4055 domain-containing protein [Acinetobacter baumannii]|uniref:DUF4055 domain-containing protein n=1 Tax=Acinetobacter baumannii TaxID=470 RepID=UPI001CC1B731|nr:DUF4055 domain-containing protein [Acinetobacter baumannii]UAS48404.1 DUF4055 domain-containing protein [Acinetobacter baumannii]